MELVMIGSTDYQRNLAKMVGMDYADITEINEIPNDQYLVIYDPDCMFQEPYIKLVKSKGFSLFYFFQTKDNTIIECLINNGYYNLHKLRDEITLDDILDAAQNLQTQEDALKYLDKDIHIKSFNDVVNTLDKFLHAVKDCDEATLEEIYSSGFDKLLTFKETINSTLLKDSQLTIENERITQDMTKLKQEHEDLVARHDKLIVCGRETEQNNIKLTAVVEQAKQQLIEKDNSLKESDSKVKQLTLQLNNLENDKLELQHQVLTLKNDRDIIKTKLDKTSKEFDTLSATLNQSKSNLEDFQIQVLKTGKVEKYLYIKMYDMVPNILDYFEKYPKYSVNKLQFSGCSILVICPKESSLYYTYKSKYFDLLEKQGQKIPQGIYILNGFTEKIEDLISNLDSQVLIILDLTLRVNLLTSGNRQKNIYVVNSEETINANRLNPADCLSYDDLSSIGVSCRFPVIPEGTSGGAALRIVRESLYNIIDTYWR